MNGSHVLATLSFSLALIATDGDRARAPGRVLAGPSAVHSAASIPMDQFFITGWISPPVDSTSPERMAELAGAGMNLVLPALGDSGKVEDNLARLDLAAALGQRCIIWDRRFEQVVGDRPETFTIIDSIVADYRDHPAMFAYYLGDEPPRQSFEGGEQFYAAVRAKDPAHPTWNNLSGRGGFITRDEWLEHHRAYIRILRPAVLCNDHYDFLESGDRHQFVENAAGLNALAREAGIPFWSFILLIQHVPYRGLEAGELKWQVSILLAYGAHGIGYFTYWTPPPNPANQWRSAIIDQQGDRTGWYPVVARFNRLVLSAGQRLARCNWLATVHAGSLPPGGTWFTPNEWVSSVEGRSALGYFSDSTGGRYLVVTNSDSLSPRMITLTLPGAESACVLDESHDTWDRVTCEALPYPPASVPRPEGQSRTQSDGILALNLGAGSFAVVKLEGGSVGGVTGGAAPGLSIRPNPAQGQVRMTLDRVGHGARLEIVDAGGRRVWSRPVDPGANTLTWRGEHESGGATRPGIYFARLEDERGLTVVRFVWLGAS